MKALTTGLLPLAVALAGCSGIHSTIAIDPGEQFVLGGEQRGAFQTRLTNLGRDDVDIAERNADGETAVRATLSPGAGATLRFADGSAALLINRSTRTASVRGVITGDTRLGMRYTPVGGEQPGD